MKKPDRALHELARRVMKAQAAPETTAGAADAMERSCGELYRVLETAMGPDGLQALMARAIQLTARDYLWLATVQPGAAADCPLSGLTEAAERLHVKDATAGYAALLATMVWLLMSFIGEDLTMRFVRHAWPKVPLTSLSEE